MMNLIDLFSGIGAVSLGLERTGGIRTVSSVEIDPFCRAVLQKNNPDVPIHDDVSTRDYQRGEADIIAGGFPCQDLSLAGKRTGLSGARSGLYREMVRAIRLVRPRFAIVENVAALLGNGMGRVLGDVAEDGYDAEWDCISSSDVGAPHGRDRVWITLADANEFKRPDGRGAAYGWWLWRKGEVAETRDANGMWELQPPRLLGNIRRWVDNAARSRAWWSCDWQAQFETFRRMDAGAPDGLDRSANAEAVKRLGNTNPPQIAEIIGRAILASYAGGEA